MGNKSADQSDQFVIGSLREYVRYLDELNNRPATIPLKGGSVDDKQLKLRVSARDNSMA